jgi:hypothetical protein
VVSPGVLPGVVTGFDGATPVPGGLAVVYPNPGAIIPHDLAPIDVQWTPPAGENVWRVTFAVDNGNKLRGFVNAPSWTPPQGDWKWLLDRAAGHGVTITVLGATSDAAGMLGAQVIASMEEPLRVSRDDATGALFYFATTGDQITGDGTLERLEVGSQKPAKYLNKSNNGGRCVGCHTLTRDGKRLAFTFLDLVGPAGTISLGSVDANDPTMQQAAAGQGVAQSVYNHDGTRLLTAFQGKLTLRDPVTGAKLADVDTGGPAYYPDWSADGGKLVFVSPSAPCTVSGFANFGQDSIFVYGGSLVTMDWNGTTFVNRQVILQAQNGENNYYPAFSPDGSYIAFSRADATTKSTWLLGNMACSGKDGSGVSYDNPSATVWLLPSAGGAPVAIPAANGGTLRTNSWPKWGPKKDGEFLWLLFSSTRPYGNVLTGAMAHHQLWVTAIARPGTSEANASDLSAPAVWFPFQTLTTKNHIGQWSFKVGDFQIP